MENIEAANKGAGGRIDSLKKDLRGNMINVNQSLKLKVFQETACDSYNIPFYIQIRFHLYFTNHWSLSSVITCLATVKGGMSESSKVFLASDSF